MLISTLINTSSSLKLIINESINSLLNTGIVLNIFIKYREEKKLKEEQSHELS